jgi:hypothetical protein
MLRWNMTLAQLASGERQEVDADAVRRLAETGDKHLIVSSLTDLEILARYYCGLHPGANCQDASQDAIKKAKERFVEAAWSPPSFQGSAAAGNLAQGSAAIDLSPYALRWRGQLPNLKMGRDRLVFIWYAYDPQWEVWRALPEVSGPVDLVDNKEVKDLSGGGLEINFPYLARTDWTRCLPAGRYRAELYINGKLTPNPPEAKNTAGDFEPKRLFDLNVALCCPENWQPLDVLKRIKDPPHGLKVDSLLIRGFETDKTNGKPAAFVFTFYPSMSGGGSGGSIEGQKEAAVQRAKALLTEMKWINDTDVCTPYDPTKGCDTDAPSGGVLYKHWVTSEGVQYVGMVLVAAAPIGELWHTLHSMTNLYEPITVAKSGK